MIAVLYICIGEYYRFFEDFYRSSEKYFCPDVEKSYFVFSDDSYKIPKYSNVVVVEQDNMGWPLNTLFRFKMFMRTRELLESYKHIIFFNSNCLFVEKISIDEVFCSDGGITCCTHPGYFDSSEETLPFERRPRSSAFVETGQAYYAGGLIGGGAVEFLDACRTLDKNIDIDFNAGIVAKWHDESHWNSYVEKIRQTHSAFLKVLHPGYLYPEGYNIPYQKKISLRKKSRYIALPAGKNFPKGKYFKFSEKMRNFICKIF